MAEGPSDCTHLVTKAMYRTIKFMLVLAQGHYIVHPDWVFHSIEAGKLLREYSIKSVP